MSASCLRRIGSEAWVTQRAPKKLVSIWKRISSCVSSSTLPNCRTPALLTMTSSRPKWSAASRTTSSEKARTTLGWTPRPIEDSIEDCARSLLA
jgi:hypothetical protein